ncbi:uncharacterized protein LOC131319581 isoform X2 [Rhododendron vialii]|uniref:uncharacterized protein LOC131319581 isoform X2 n=1 Tax=Rhododendron vialii TaxID=182163 RepID=UPI00265F0193|nr:uncharacterized protein LOC131319581 isoform X2 [Rhododendron vialii]
MEGAEDNRQEKTSVFQKAKAKARKMKDTIKMKTGHGQDLDNTNQNDQGHDEEEDEQMVEDSEVHDTVPKYESPAVTSTVAGQKKPDDKLGKPATAAEDQYGSKYTDAQTRPSSQWPDENTDNRGVDTARPTGMGAAGVQVPKNRDGLFSSSGALGAPGSESAGNFVHGDGGHMGDPKISSETPAAMEEDPYKPDYQSKVADPTGAGGEEAGINSIMKSFNKLNVDDGEPESKPISERAPETYTESQDHFSQEPILPTSTINPDDPGSISKSFDGDKPEDAPLDNVTNLSSNQSSYAQKIPYADKAIAAKNVVASKLGYGSTEDPTTSPKATQGGEEIGKPGMTTDYGQKIVAPESFNKVNADDGEPESKPISERAPETYTESQDHFSPEPIPPTSTINPDDPGSISKSFDGDKPEDTPLDNVTNPPSNQSSYPEKISYATSAITDTAIAAKNVVASKLGYGSTEDPTASPKATQGGEEIGKPGTTTVYEKVSNVGSSVVSKVRGTGTKQDQGVEGQDQGDEGQDQGVKGYLAEKLRPSDDDKALSEVISDTLHNRKQEVDGEEEGENQKPAVGTVTESEEVRERLGSDEGNRGMTETESKAAANASPTGKGMVESVKGTVTSWFSRGGDQKQTSEASPGTIPEEERLSSSTGEEAVGHGQIGVGEPGEGRLQESGK